MVPLRFSVGDDATIGDGQKVTITKMIQNKITIVVFTTGTPMISASVEWIQSLIGSNFLMSLQTSLQLHPAIHIR